MLYVYAPSVAADGRGRDWFGGALAYIHTELSHQHTLVRPGHTLCAATSPFTHTVRNGAGARARTCVEERERGRMFEFGWR